MKEIYPLIKNRRTTRSFLPQKITDEDLQLILEAGRWAPSSMNMQPWHFLVIRNKKMMNFLWNSSYYHYKSTESKDSHLPSVMIAIIIDTTVQPDATLVKDFEKQFSPHLNYMNAAMAALNMIYQAEAVGLSSGIKTPVATDLKAVLKLPAGQECPIIVTIGHASQKEQVSERTRKPFSELVFFEKYGKKTKPFL